MYTDFLTNKRIRNKRDGVRNEANERHANDLKSEIEATVNRCLEVVAFASIKLNMLGDKLQVNEVKKLDFHIHFKK